MHFAIYLFVQADKWQFLRLLPEHGWKTVVAFWAGLSGRHSPLFRQDAMNRDSTTKRGEHKVRPYKMADGHGPLWRDLRHAMSLQRNTCFNACGYAASDRRSRCRRRRRSSRARESSRTRRPCRRFPRERAPWERGIENRLRPFRRPE
jgi:hypothetical protein